jgi:hypothetical protein
MTPPDEALDGGNGWQPIETAPKDGTAFLAWMRPNWIEIMYYSDGDIFYGSDGDAPPHGRSLPRYWMPAPPSPFTPPASRLASK